MNIIKRTGSWDEFAGWFPEVEKLRTNVTTKRVTIVANDGTVFEWSRPKELYDRRKTAKITVNCVDVKGEDHEYDYYLTKIDSTHFDMVNNPDLIGRNINPMHIGEIRHRNYYADVLDWLHSLCEIDGKTYLSL